MSDITQLVFCICCNKCISRKCEREHRRQALKPPTNPTPCKRPRLAFKAARTPRDKAKPACKPPECQDMFSTLDLEFPVPLVTFFLLIIVHITDYHWDRHLYFVIHSHHAQTMTHTPPSDDSILILRLVVLVACDSD
jgi:hypothetical protein